MEMIKSQHSIDQDLDIYWSWYDQYGEGRGSDLRLFSHKKGNFLPWSIDCHQYKIERGCSFFIACATILCGGLDFQDIWVKNSDILPYLYGYGLKKYGNPRKSKLSKKNDTFIT